MMSPEELFDAGVKAGTIVSQKGPWFAFGKVKLGPGKSGAVKKLTADKNLCRKLEAAMTVVTAPSTLPQPPQPIISVRNSYDSPVPTGDLRNVGIRTVDRVIEKPTMNAAEQQTYGAYQNRIVREQVSQPILTEEEAIGLGGPYGWHQFRRADHLFTTVIQGRRFLIEKEIFHRMKDGGLAIQVG